MSEHDSYVDLRETAAGGYGWVKGDETLRQIEPVDRQGAIIPELLARVRALESDVERLRVKDRRHSRLWQILADSGLEGFLQHVREVKARIPRSGTKGQ